MIYIDGDIRVLVKIFLAGGSADSFSLFWGGRGAEMTFIRAL